MIAYLLEEYECAESPPKSIGVAVTNIETAIGWCENQYWRRNFTKILISDVLDADQIELITKGKNYEESNFSV